MCQDCGCSITEHSHEIHEHTHDMQNIHANPQLNDKITVDVITKILDKNDHEAGHNRAHFDKHGVLAINIMSSPGSGKTALLEKIADMSGFKFGVIEGDLETSRDADRLRAKGIPAYQIQTGSACHLDAFMVHKGLHDMPLSDIDVCFVENVGNLVCPASYDVGTHLNIVLVSVPEGNDKIEKYPVMFRKADLVLITKTDLLPYIEYDIEAEKKEARKLKPNVDILEISTKDDDSIKKVIEWIELKMVQHEKKVNGLSLISKGDSKNRAIIFIHGFPFDHTAWQAQVDIFSADYYCVAYDVRGLGESLVGDGQFTMESFVDDLSEVMDEFNLDKPILCAHSMGGYISLRALERMQERFSAVILLDTVSGADNNEGKLKRAAAIKRINSEGLAPFVKDFIALCYGESYKEEHKEDFEKRIALSSSFNPVGVKGSLLAMLSRNDTTVYLNKITIPSLLLCGENDALTPSSVMQEMSKEMKNSEFVVIRNSAHMSAIENPVDVNSAIKSFLEKL